MEQQGAAVVILDAELNGTRLIEVIDELVNSPQKLDDMGNASKKIGCPKAAESIAKMALTMIK